jgi:hypothetical protein
MTSLRGRIFGGSLLGGSRSLRGAGRSEALLYLSMIAAGIYSLLQTTGYLRALAGWLCVEVAFYVYQSWRYGPPGHETSLMKEAKLVLSRCHSPFLGISMLIWGLCKSLWSPGAIVWLPSGYRGRQCTGLLPQEKQDIQGQV